MAERKMNHQEKRPSSVLPIFLFCHLLFYPSGLRPQAARSRGGAEKSKSEPVSCSASLRLCARIIVCVSRRYVVPARTSAQENEIPTSSSTNLPRVFLPPDSCAWCPSLFLCPFRLRTYISYGVKAAPSCFRPRPRVPDLLVVPGTVFLVLSDLRAAPNVRRPRPPGSPNSRLPHALNRLFSFLLAGSILRRKKRRGGSGNRSSWPRLPCLLPFVGRPPTVST